MTTVDLECKSRKIVAVIQLPMTPAEVAGHRTGIHCPLCGESGWITIRPEKALSARDG